MLKRITQITHRDPNFDEFVERMKAVTGAFLGRSLDRRGRIGRDDFLIDTPVEERFGKGERPVRSDWGALNMRTDGGDNVTPLNVVDTARYEGTQQAAVTIDCAASLPAVPELRELLPFILVEHLAKLSFGLALANGLSLRLALKRIRIGATDGFEPFCPSQVTGS